MTDDKTGIKTKYYLFIAVGLIATIIYWLTAYRSITWWVGTSYTATAISLGVNFPPGSLIATILGWPVSLLPLGISKALMMNFLAGLITTATLILTMILSLRIFGYTNKAKSEETTDYQSIMILSGAAIACLFVGFSTTVWTYSIQYTPYVLTALFTVLILWAMFKWWKIADTGLSFRWLFIIFLLVGLDFSVHRTNLLLVPGIIIWVLLRYPKTLSRFKSWWMSIAGLVLGLVFHLLTIPIASLKPFVNANDPSNLSRFYDYISLKQYGGSWLVNLFPRKAPFFGSQLADYINYFKSNLIDLHGPLGIIIILVPILIVLGIIFLWRKNWKLCLGLIIQFLCLSLLAVFYFNTPGGFYWPMDRHYIPSYIIIAIFMAYALGFIINYLWNKAGGNRAVTVLLLIILAAFIPLKQVLGNCRVCDGAKKHFAYDYAHNILNSLPQNSILFINGDNYWPFVYFNGIEKVRPDVTVISQSLLNTHWYLRQILNEHPDLPIHFTDEEISSFGAMRWQDTTLMIEIAASDSASSPLPDSLPPDTFALEVKPTISDVAIMGEDWFMIKLLIEDKWQHPIYFNNPPPWLEDHCRPEGLIRRALPVDEPPVDAEILRHNLLDIYSFRGFADPNISIDRFTRSVGNDYYFSFLTLVDYYISNDDKTTGQEIYDKMLELLPPEHVKPVGNIIGAIEKIKSELKSND